MDKTWDLWKAIKLIASSILCISLPATILTYHFFLKPKNAKNAVCITKIIQTGPQKEALKTRFFSELLGLSIDKKMPVNRFDLKRAKALLEKHPVIEKAELSFVEKDVLFIDYIARNPIALLGNYDNCALDKSGHVFPLKPFFPPKKLPTVYFPSETFATREGSFYDTPLMGPEVDLAFTILDLLQNEELKGTFEVKTIDVSKAFEKSLGRQEIVLEIEENIPYPVENGSAFATQERFLRFSVKGVAKGLGNYLKLREKMAEEALSQIKLSGASSIISKKPIIDLRIEKLAFIKEDK